MAPREQPTCGVYRFDPKTDELSRVSGSMVKPNGLCFNVEETALFVSDTGASHVPDGPKALYRFDCDASGPHLRSPDFSRNALPDYLMGFASTPTTAFGHQRATECIVTHPMARSLEKSKSLKLYQTSALEGRG